MQELVRCFREAHRNTKKEGFESGADVYEYLQNHSFTELTQEVVDRFVKRIVVYDERNLEVEWKFSEELPEEVREYQLAYL